MHGQVGPTRGAATNLLVLTYPTNCPTTLLVARYLLIKTLVARHLHQQLFMLTPVCPGYLTYQYWRGRALENLPLPHVTVFLDAKPKVCHDRIHLRARVSKVSHFVCGLYEYCSVCWLQECESGVSLDYLLKLHHEYVKFINEIRCQGSQVLTYDWSTFKDEAIVRCSPIVCLL